MQPLEPLVFKDDRYGGVEVDVTDAAARMEPAAFATALRDACDSWAAQGKCGIWLRVPTNCGGAVGAAAANGFDFHHAQPGYAMLTRWLHTGVPSTLPKYGFTQIGVGGVVVNSRGEVLMVQEKVAPIPQFQGAWKVPGGLADPGEDFATTAIREVREETGVAGELDGVVTLRHSHGYRFGQGDLYVLVKLRAADDTLCIDPVEICAARWMGVDEVKSLVERDSSASLDGKVSVSMWAMIEAALDRRLIEATALPGRNGKPGPTMYAAAL